MRAVAGVGVLDPAEATAVRVRVFKAQTLPGCKALFVSLTFWALAPFFEEGLAT